MVLVCAWKPNSVGKVRSMTKRTLRFEQLEGRHLLASAPWYNATREFDVNNDGYYAPNDALTVINYLNAFTPAASAVPADASLGTPYGFIDTDPDNIITPNDALSIINAINAGLTAPEAAFLLPQSDVREGEFFVVSATAPFIGKSANLVLQHDGQPVFEYDPLELSADSDIRLVMPDVLLPGYAEDGYKLLLKNAQVSEEFPVTVHEGLRMTIDSDNDSEFFREGDDLVFHVRNGIGKSEVVAELLNGDEIVQRKSFETNEEGAIESKDGHFQIDQHLFIYDREKERLSLSPYARRQVRRRKIHDPQRVAGVDQFPEHPRGRSICHWMPRGSSRNRRLCDSSS